MPAQSARLLIARGATCRFTMTPSALIRAHPRPSVAQSLPFNPPTRLTTTAKPNGGTRDPAKQDPTKRTPRTSRGVRSTHCGYARGKAPGGRR